MSTHATTIGPTYTCGNSEVNFYRDDQKGLSVTIDTERLHIRNIKKEDFNHYETLFGDPTTMETFAEGKTYTSEELAHLINEIWVKRWQKHDPYSALAIFNNDQNEFIGHVMLGPGNKKPGEAELGYVIQKERWGHGYAAEAATAVVKEFGPALVQEGYPINGKPLERIFATASMDNEGSQRVLQKVGMQQENQEEKHGAMRTLYSMDLFS